MNQASIRKLLKEHGKTISSYQFNSAIESLGIQKSSSYTEDEVYRIAGHFNVFVGQEQELVFDSEQEECAAIDLLGSTSQLSQVQEHIDAAFSAIEDQVADYAVNREMQMLPNIAKKIAAKRKLNGVPSIADILYISTAPKLPQSRTLQLTSAVR